MTRQEIEERAVAAWTEVGDSWDSNEPRDAVISRHLTALAVAALEEAARAVCWKCEGGEETAPKLAAERFHYDYAVCPATKIHDLIAALKPKEVPGE